MTPDEHAAQIADRLWDAEKAVKRVAKSLRELHAALDAAQSAFNNTYPGQVQIRSGGADRKPHPGDDELPPGP